MPAKTKKTSPAQTGTAPSKVMVRWLVAMREVERAINAVLAVRDILGQDDTSLAIEDLEQARAALLGSCPWQA